MEFMEYSGIVVDYEGNAAQLTKSQDDGNIKISVIEMEYKNAIWIRIRRDPVA
jgi:hypothetical protein